MISKLRNTFWAGSPTGWVAALLLIYTMLAGAVAFSEMSPNSDKLTPNSGWKVGLWVEVEGPWKPLESRERIDEMLSDAAELGVTDIFLQVYRGGRAWFHSSFADQNEFLEAQRQGYDPLAYAIERARLYDLRVHAWLNLFNLAANREATIIKRLGNKIVARDSYGVSVLDYNSKGRPPGERGKYFMLETPAVWLDPGHPLVRIYFNALVGELIERYPQLQGVHLDYVRYPYLLPMRPSSGVRIGADFGYSPATLASFTVENELQRPFTFQSDGFQPNSPTFALTWDNWRRAQIEGYVQDFSKIIGSQRVLTAALQQWSDRAYQTAYQNWPKWLSEESIAAGCLMTYTKNNEQFWQLVKQGAAFKQGGAELLAGIGTWIMDIPQIHEQMRLAREAGADGVVLFSYGNLKKREQKLGALIASIKDNQRPPEKALAIAPAQKRAVVG